MIYYFMFTSVPRLVVNIHTKTFSLHVIHTLFKCCEITYICKELVCTRSRRRSSMQVTSIVQEVPMEKRHISVFALPEIKDDLTAFMDESVQQLLANVKVCIYIILLSALQRWFVNVISFNKNDSMSCY